MNKMISQTVPIGDKRNQIELLTTIVDAVQVGKFVVHRTVMADTVEFDAYLSGKTELPEVEIHESRWTVTHIAACRSAFNWIPSKIAAMEIAHYLDEACPDDGWKLNNSGDWLMNMSIDDIDTIKTDVWDRWMVER